MNPNGSEGGVAGVCSDDGRHFAFMPHPERSFISWQIPMKGMPTIGTALGKSFSPWIKLFCNAKEWCHEYDAMLAQELEVPSPQAKRIKLPGGKFGLLKPALKNSTPLLRVGVLLSGSGTTLQNILDRIDDGSLTNVRIQKVVASRPSAGGLERAEDAGVPTSVVHSLKFKNQETGETDWQAMSAEITDHLGDVDLVVLAGFMCLYKVPPKFVGKVINVHPALIPHFSGKGMYGDRVHTAVLAASATKTGCTVHFVDGQYDHGPIILQKECKVAKKDTVNSLREKVQTLEREALVAVIQKVFLV